MSSLNKEVLVLNRNWVPIDTVNVRHALGQMASGQVMGVDCGLDKYFAQISWEDWFLLDVREDDDFIQTSTLMPDGSHLRIRAPRVVVSLEFNGMSVKKPKLNSSTLCERDGGVCAYTLRKLAPHERTMEHVLPRSRGGTTTWDNVVLADRKINNRRGNKTLAEAGLTLKKKPFVPKPKPFVQTIKKLAFPEWEHFVFKNK